MGEGPAPAEDRRDEEDRKTGKDRNTEENKEDKEDRVSKVLLHLCREEASHTDLRTLMQEIASCMDIHTAAA